MSDLEAPVLVVNRSWFPVAVTHVADALTKLYAGTARVIDETYSVHDFDAWCERSAERASDESESLRFIRTPRLSILVPEAIALTSGARHRPRTVSFSKRGVFRRDGYVCQYCGHRPGGKHLTIDHVVPRARGGTSLWTNCVAACRTCNQRKRDRTPLEAGMDLARVPFVPRWNPVSRISSQSWTYRLTQPLS